MNPTIPPEAFAFLTKITDLLVNGATYFARKRRVERSRKKLLWEIVTKVLDDYCPVWLDKGRISEVNFFFQTQEKHKGAWKKLKSPRSQISLLILAIICNGMGKHRINAMLTVPRVLGDVKRVATSDLYGLDWRGNPETDSARCYEDLFTEVILPKIVDSVLELPPEVLDKVRGEANKLFKEADLMDPPLGGEKLEGWLPVTIIQHYPTIIGGDEGEKTRLIPGDVATQKVFWKLAYGMKMGKELSKDPRSVDYQCDDDKCKKRHIWHVSLYRRSGGTEPFSSLIYTAISDHSPTR